MRLESGQALTSAREPHSPFNLSYFSNYCLLVLPAPLISCRNPLYTHLPDPWLVDHLLNRQHTPLNSNAPEPIAGPRFLH